MNIGKPNNMNILPAKFCQATAVFLTGNIFFSLWDLVLNYVDGDLQSTQVYIKFGILDGPMLLIFRQYVARFYKVPFFLHSHI
jgi:hypothetical protein